MEVPKQEKPVDISDAIGINAKATEIFKDQLKGPKGKNAVRLFKSQRNKWRNCKIF